MNEITQKIVGDNMREDGYYWTKLDEGGIWCCSKYIKSIDKGFWFIPSFEKLFHDGELYKINENRILNPDE
jgi:hypothetical protein